MAKQGMKRPNPRESGNRAPKNEAPPVPESQGKAKTTKQRAKPQAHSSR